MLTNYALTHLKQMLFKMLTTTISHIINLLYFQITITHFNNSNHIVATTNRNRN